MRLFLIPVLLGLGLLLSCSTSKKSLDTPKAEPCFCDETHMDSLLLEGLYQGKNLYIQNPFTDDGMYAVRKVYVNSDIYNAKLDATAFEIDFKTLNLKKGDSINIVIYYCCNLPKVIHS